MRGELLDIHSIVSNEDLHGTLQNALQQYFARQVRIAAFERRVSQYCSSYILEELDVTLDDGTRLELIFKDLSKAALLASAERIKPHFIYNPMREIDTYRKVLALHRLGTPTFYGAHVEPQRARYWLFIERVPPTLLWQMGEFAIWEETARWLAGMHSYLVRETEVRESQHIAHLLSYDREFYTRWMERAEAYIGLGDSTPGGKSAKAIRWLSARYAPVVERLLAMPVTVIHGEFYASNVLVDQALERLRVCPVDWEMAAVGPGLVDLAGLTSGGWTAEQKAAMALAYYRALPVEMQAARDEATFLADLECCRLHQAVQWLGWSSGWKPVEEHAQDWLKEAVRCAEALGL